MFTKSSTAFTGVRVAVTGGTSGLGLALVRELLGRGAESRSSPAAAIASNAIAREHPGAHGIVGDVSLKEDIHPIAIQIIGELGGVDVLVNNASDLGPAPLKLLADTDCEELERALATNLLGPFRLTKALLGALSASARERGGAVVLNVSSDAAINAVPVVGRLRREQGGASSLEPDLGRRARGRRRARPVDGSGRHGHPASRAGGSRRRPRDAEAAGRRGARAGGRHRGGACLREARAHDRRGRSADSASGGREAAARRRAPGASATCPRAAWPTSFAPAIS